MRREFALPKADEGFLEARGLPWETLNSGGQWLLMHNFPVPDGYNHDQVSVAVLISSGYPEAQLDMVFFSPALARLDGKVIKATQAKQQLDGKEWQRWSRHRTAQNPWRPGVDNIETHFLLINDWLEREFLNR